MSTSVLHFTPRAELGALGNVEAFIELCKGSLVSDAKAQFDKNIWDVGRFKGQNKVHRAVFSTLEASSLDRATPSLPAPFLAFAKATLVYLHDKRPVTSQSVRIAALRCLEAALRGRSLGSRPTAVTEEVLDAAVELARQQVSAGVAYRIAGQLDLIAEFMRSKGFTALRQKWTHGMKKPKELGSRVSKEALEARQEKLPSAAALRALGNIFRDAVEPSDIVVSSITALMLCAPERINEVLRLRRNCIVEGDGEFKGKLGLRWPGSKGFENTVKWLPSEMVPIAREAVANLLTATAPAQKVAAWYTEHPQELYLHEAAAHLRNKAVLTVSEIALILWGDGESKQAKNSATTWARTTHKLQGHSLGGKSWGCLFEDVEQAVLSMLPGTFPHVPGAPELLCKDAMAVMRTSEMHSTKSTYLGMFSTTDYNGITNHLKQREGQVSIFERFNFTEDDGSSIELRSHSLRHYLNMLAQSGGLSSTEIALFSGRKDVRQNRAYDHMTSEEVQAPIRQALTEGFTSELEVTTSAGRDLFARQEFAGLRLTAAHTTEFGWCVHDFASEPCQVYRDCINCEEQECVKGEAQKEANLRQLKNETEHLLKQAKAALNEEEYGADTWVKHQSQTLERVNTLLSILEDPAVPAGSRIRLDVTNAPLVTSNDAHPVKLVRRIRQK